MFNFNRIIDTELDISAATPNLCECKTNYCYLPASHIHLTKMPTVHFLNCNFSNINDFIYAKNAREIYTALSVD